jgi:hypothetical protein
VQPGASNRCDGGNLAWRRGRKSGGDAHIWWGAGTAVPHAGTLRWQQRCCWLQLRFKRGTTGPAGGEAERREKRGGRREEGWSLTRRKPTTGTGTALQLLELWLGSAPRKSEDRAASDKSGLGPGRANGGQHYRARLLAARTETGGRHPVQPMQARRVATQRPTCGSHR